MTGGATGLSDQFLTRGDGLFIAGRFLARGQLGLLESREGISELSAFVGTEFDNRHAMIFIELRGIGEPVEEPDFVTFVTDAAQSSPPLKGC